MSRNPSGARPFAAGLGPVREIGAFFALVFLPLPAGCARRDLDGDLAKSADTSQRFDGTMPVPGAVAADHELASEAGARVLRAGGNAVDAAIAAVLASGVVQPSGSGLGGGGFALVVPPRGEPNVLDFREVAPLSASMESYAAGASSTVGGLAVAVPSEGIGLAELHRMYGRIPLSVIVAPAVELATNGFPTGEHLAKSLEDAPDMRALFLMENRRPALGDALRAWAETDGAAFRDGWVADDFIATANAHGGALSKADFAAYKVKLRKPLSGTWDGHTVLTMPPPSSGGIAILQLLGATDGATSVHCQVEAAKHAMADRSAFGADPDFAPIDVARLLSPERIRGFASDCGAATFPSAHYAPTAPINDDHGTLHVSAMDAEGWAVALTTTINTSFGSHLIAPRSGIVLNNEMDDFATKLGAPNAYGLIQGAQNAVQPGKRPLSSMSPTIVLGADGRAELAVGASGGPFIISATYQVVRGVLGGQSVSEAVAAPRWHHQWMPDAVLSEAGVSSIESLKAAGHDVRIVDKPFCAVQAVQRNADGFSAASDPRKGGKPAYSP